MLFYPSGYSCDPIFASASGIAAELRKFSFVSCEMSHEAASDPGEAVSNCAFTKSGFNLGCAHSDVRESVNDKLFLKDVVDRLHNEETLNSAQAVSFKNKVSTIEVLLYAIDVLTRNAQPARMKLFPDWKTHRADKPRNDRIAVSTVLDINDDYTLVRRMIQKCYDSFSVNNQGNTILNKPHEFKIRLKIAHTILASDLLKLSNQLAGFCELAGFSHKHS